MTCQEVKNIVGEVPHMTPGQARTITSFITEKKVTNILELGFRHGVSTCYMAAALAELGRGSVVTIDLDSARREKPSIEELLERVGVRDSVTVFYEPTSYTWRLMRFLEENPAPRFDLCYLDGAHSWFVDGFAFFLVDRLLRPGGWIILDDLNWTYAQSPSLKESEWVKNMPLDEKTTPQVSRVYQLLVKTHPGYHNFSIKAGWAYAQKRDGLSPQGLLGRIRRLWAR